MSHIKKHLSASLIAITALMAAPMASWAAPASSLNTFAILSAGPATAPGAVSLTNSVVNGDVGSSGPAASVVLVGSTINGSIIAPVSAGVVNAFNTALSNGLSLTCDQTLTQDAYTGATLMLASGVTCSATAALTFTDATLVLDGSGPWTVVVSSAPAADGSRTGALTGTGLNVVLADGITPAPCDAITWYVAQAATMTGNSVGTIYAGAAITSTGVAVTPLISTFNGSALAGAGVTMTDTTVTACAATGGHGNHGHDNDHEKCNQGVGNGPEDCDPGNSNLHNPFRSDDDARSNDEDGGTSGNPGRKGGDHHD